ncbi:hypothetical protein EVAR_10180_1 [Eumeta japonica]|uniref:Uncharacterized protein n=1 Tax=Eumeta variegata TaxID=151549 RepID=A0A4C1TDG0_EUMVA|nr:hypothetical protein EVAR_10180_1 [Eumeta japonica]
MLVDSLSGTLAPTPHRPPSTNGPAGAIYVTCIEILKLSYLDEYGFKTRGVAYLDIKLRRAVCAGARAARAPPALCTARLIDPDIWHYLCLSYFLSANPLARGRPIIVEWERDKVLSFGDSPPRYTGDSSLRYCLTSSIRAATRPLSKETAPVIKDITINVLTYKLFITIDRSRSLISLPPIDHATSAATVSDWTGTRRPTDRLTDTERRFGISLAAPHMS